jgi:hypothetical protein
MATSVRSLPSAEHVRIQRKPFRLERFH